MKPTIRPHDQHHDADPSTTPDGADSTLMVSMLDDHLVLSTPSQLDLETTKVLVIAAASAVAAGSTVMIDLDPGTATDELVARRPLAVTATNCIAGDDGPVDVLGAGYVRLTTRDAHWTIDLAHGRLCRSDDAIEPHFVVPEAWTPIQALWVSPTNVTALTTLGTYLSTRAAWTAAHRTNRPVPA